MGGHDAGGAPARHGSRGLLLQQGVAGRLPLGTVGRHLHEPTLDLAHDLAGDDQHVAVGQPRRRGDDERGQVVARPDVTDTGDRPDLQRHPALPSKTGGKFALRFAPRLMPPTSRAVRTISAVALSSIIHSGQSTVVTPGTLTPASTLSTSQPSSTPPPDRAP